MKKGDVLELEIEKYAFEGRGIAKINKTPAEEGTKYVVFVDGSYPGDKVKAELRKIKKSYAEAKAVEILERAESRVPAKCKYFGTCGGCKQQDLSYEFQYKYKKLQVEEIFNKMGGFTDFIIEDIAPSDKTFFYRNKMEFSFADKRWITREELNSSETVEKNFALGLHVPSVFDKVLDVDECFLQSELSNKILNLTRKFFKEKSISIYSTKTHSGYLRNLVIKTSHHSDDLMVNIVTSSEDEVLMEGYVNLLKTEVPQITTIINNISQKKAAIATGDYEKVLYGSGFISDFIGEYKFRVSANSFFQTNTLQAEKLYQTALDFAGLNGNETVYDLYSGAGTISIFVSGKAKEVYAFESVESAVKDAEENKIFNGINNVHFIQADLYKSFLPAIEEQGIPGPDVVILDPPRSGMHQNTIDDVIKCAPDRIVYVSCNPTTQVRDIKLFTKGGYKLVKIKPVDMFPHTYHIENVALLAKE
ncbi:MAG: 23S rRNA (uracil(1939)-C(5))-methyltransferase RlmD [Ignavibacteriaceae bacterium]|nr:23S rRNA (uracil(1939)-C(5))-methyltransferase RlmD [Ignavibacteriaceae bacterium]